MLHMQDQVVHTGVSKVHRVPSPVMNVTSFEAVR